MNKTYLPEEIITDKICLRKHSLKIASEMFEAVDSDRNRLQKFLPWVQHTRALEDTVSYIRMALEKWEEGTLFDYSIFEKKENSYIGNIGLHTISWEHHKGEIGYWILGDYEGQGLMSDAVRALEKACFEAGFHRIEIRCSFLNLRSAAIPQRLGYSLDGTLREDFIENGKYRNTLIFSKLKTEISS